MALLTIAEPGQSAAPHQKKVAVGIDLGTTNSLVATMKNATLDIIPDSQGRKLCPSVVNYGEKETIIGYEALALAKEDPENTIVSVKRFIGKTHDEIKTQNSNLPYKMQQSANNLPIFETRAGNKNAIEVSADILRRLKNQATASLGNELTGVVITVPAYFDDTQRQATKDAAKLAGLNVLRLLNEPTAAAIAYGINEEQEGTIVVYDLGGGTFDVSILKIEKGVFRVLATGGDTSLGGDDFDALLVKKLEKELTLKIDDLDKLSKRKLLELAIAIKKELSFKEAVKLADLSEFEILSSHLNLIDKADFIINREFFNSLISPLINKTLMVCHSVLRDAQVIKDEINEVILVGGSTRIPFLQDKVESFFVKKPLCSIDPDTVVALGAAMQADLLVGNSKDKDYLLLDVLPLSLGVEVYGGLVEKIIPRNTTIPVARAQEFTTAQDGQTGLKLHVVQGERDMAVDCRSLANFSLKGLPPRAAGALKIRVTYQVDADGLLSVNARELTTNVSTEVQVKLSYGLTEDEVLKMLQDSTEYAELDIALRKLSESHTEAKLLSDSVIGQLKLYKHLLSQEDLENIEDNLERLTQLLEKHSLDKLDRQQLSNNDAQTLKENANAISFWASQLEISTREFAAAIMTANIQDVLKGKDINKM